MSYLALFLTPSLDVIGSKKFKPTEKFVNFKKGTFNIRLEAYLYKIKGTSIYAYIYPTDERLLIDSSGEYTSQEPINQDLAPVKIESARLIKIKEQVENGDLHLLVAESIIGQLARAFLNLVKTNWVLIILGVGCGVAVGYIACSVINPSHIVTIIQNQTIPSPTPILLR
jgi:hypothetical protein